MCSNRAVVESVECYMDDLVECFEDFVKKSLIIMSFGIGVIVATLLYLLKTVCDRQPLHSVMTENAARAQHQHEMRNMIEENNLNSIRNDLYIQAKQNNILKEKGLSTSNYDDEKQIPTSNNTAPRPLPTPSYDEQILRDIGLSSCSKTTCKVRNNNQVNSSSKVPIPTSATTKYNSIHSLRQSKQNISASQLYQRPLEKQGSCCSMCCNNKPSAKWSKL